jgi:hypothetical protein
MSVPAGSPECAALRCTTSAVTFALYARAFPTVYGEALCVTIEAVPQSPRDTVVPELVATDWPRTVMPLTAEPDVFPDAALPEARAVALAESEATVTSPPKSDSPETETDATAEEAADAAAVTLEEREAARTTDPSAG